METNPLPYISNKPAIVAIKRIPKEQSYYIGEIDDGHAGYAFFIQDFMAGQYPVFSICMEDPRKARRSARYLLKKMGMSRKIKGTYRHV